VYRAFENLCVASRYYAICCQQDQGYSISKEVFRLGEVDVMTIVAIGNASQIPGTKEERFIFELRTFWIATEGGKKVEEETQSQ
jgi:hypothetical protein